MAAKRGVGAAVAVEVGRVQGLESSIHDLKLRGGRGVTALIGGSIVGMPQLTRATEGSSSIELQIFDPELRWLEKALASQKWDCEIDDLWFRYIGTTKSGATMTLKFEDRDVAICREFFGPVKRYAHRGQPNELTLAEFICGLVEQARPDAPIVCPQLEEQQPIETERQAKSAAKDAKLKRQSGLGDTQGLTVKGLPATKAQKELGETAHRVAASLDTPAQVEVALFAALIVESVMGSAAPGNVLEAIGSGGAEIADAATEIRNFLTGSGGYGEGGALGYYRRHPGATFYEIAQDVQRSGAGLASHGAANYGQVGDEARDWADAVGAGGGGSGSIEQVVPRAFEVKAKGEKAGLPEDFWTAIQRYAKAVNWRAFWCAGVFYYLSEDELARGQVRLAIRRQPGQRVPVNDAVEDVDFDANANKPVTECTITAFVKKCGVPPGAVATVAGYGPASLGPGDPPPKEPPKEAIASAVKASTHEGKGRYLAAKISVPLVGHPAIRKATITARKPTRPLPEPASETRTLSVPQGSAVGNATVERMLEACENAAELKKPYIWGGEDPKTGVDCSGGVSFALRVGGFMEGRTSTIGLATFGEAGPGEFITVYDHANTGDPHSEHCAIEVAGVVFESGGGSENSNPNGGFGKVTEGVEEFLKQFEIQRHPKGF